LSYLDPQNPLRGHKRSTDKIEEHIKERVSDLIAAMAKQTIPIPLTGGKTDKDILAAIHSKLDSKAMEEANKSFKSIVNEFIALAGKASFHPLSELMKSLGDSSLAEAILKDLYQARVKRIAKLVVDPLADELFKN